MTNKIVIFAGTTEGRRLSELLAAAGIGHTVCVATEYGELVLNRHPLVQIRQGRMDREEILTFVRAGKFSIVIDATHPFAREITQNIRAAVTEMRREGTSVSCLRLKRDETVRQAQDVVTYFETNEACAAALEHTAGNILLTTGSKELPCYCNSGAVRDRLYVRVLPGMESFSVCMEQGIRGKQIIAMQGPFSVELNEAIIRQYQISCVVTKESGASGGYPEKVEAAKRTGAAVFVIGRPEEEEGASFSEICRELENLLEKSFATAEPLELTLTGIGMGNVEGLTREAEQAIREADILFGAERMLANFSYKAEKYPFYGAKELIPCLQEIQKTSRLTGRRKIVVLFSGDCGFYSGCQSLYAALEKEIREGRLAGTLRILPGVSSVAYLAACIGESYHDAAVYSLHGKELCNLPNRVRRHKKTFLLTSGVRDIHRIGADLLDAGLDFCEIITGWQMSYPEQRIRRLSPAECLDVVEEGLYTCLIINPYAEAKRLTHGMADGQFIRAEAFGNRKGIVPMTKEEVREVSICKLHLREKAVVYDIGSGSGSVAVEVAGLSDEIQVYAVERKQEAVSLMESNREKCGLQNIHVVNAEAPEGLADLPTPTQAFIGGSGGRLKEIMAVLWEKNPNLRIVITAVSMETICEIKEILPLYSIKDEEIMQIQVSRAKKAGPHHLMRAENPVWICAFTFDGGKCEGNPTEAK